MIMNHASLMEEKKDNLRFARGDYKLAAIFVILLENVLT